MYIRQYRILEKIGRGAFGNTYIAVDTEFSDAPRRVVKHLCPQNTNFQALAIAKRLFKTEAKCLYNLGEHPQIPRLYSYFEEKGEFFLVQEWIEGHNLTQEFRPGKRWSETETVLFLQELLEILSTVHQQNTIHRDIKPANIMRRQRDGKLVLIDFGAVKEILNVNHQETNTVIIGTPPYMPPEQWDGRPGKYSDVYAVGMLGIKALTGLPSSELPQDSEHLKQIWNDLNIEIEPQLKYVMERMVSLQHSQRFTDATKALKAVKRLKPNSKLKPNIFTLLGILLGVIGFTGAGITGLKSLNQPNKETAEYSTLAKVPDVPALIVRYGGSTTFAPLRSPEIEAKILQAHPGFQLSYTEPPLGEKPGSGSGIRMLIEGQLSIAQSSRGLKDEEFERAKNREFTLEQVAVAIDGIALYVNSQLSIPGLTVSQVKDIFTGKITNWSQVGGPDLDIKPIGRDPKDGGTPEYFGEKIMNEKPFAASVEPYVRDTTNSLRKVADTPGGIGYATASEVCNQSTVKSLPLAKGETSTFVSPCQGNQVNLADFVNNVYPITRRLFVIIKRDGKLDEQAGIAYVNMLLSDEGQQIVEQAGLVPLRTP